MTNEEILAQAGEGDGSLPPPPGQQPQAGQPKSIWLLISEEMERRNEAYQREMGELARGGSDPNGMEDLRRLLPRRRM